MQHAGSGTDMLPQGHRCSIWRMPASAEPDPTMPLRLRAGEFLPLRDTRGRSVAVVRGTLWVAQDDGAHDAFVGPGQTVALGRHGSAMLHALEPSSLRLLEGVSPARAGWRRLLDRAARRWAGALDSHRHIP
jgi:hypothetical protein